MGPVLLLTHSMLKKEPLPFAALHECLQPPDELCIWDSTGFYFRGAEMAMCSWRTGLYFFPRRRLKILPSLLPEGGKAAYAIKQEPSHIVMRGSNLM